MCVPFEILNVCVRFNDFSFACVVGCNTITFLRNIPIFYGQCAQCPFFLVESEAHSVPFQTSKIELLAKIVRKVSFNVAALRSCLKPRKEIRKRSTNVASWKAEILLRQLLYNFFSKLVLVITCLRGKFGINLLSSLF